MNADSFAREHEPVWAELRTLCDRARDRPQRLDPDEIRRLGALYRSVVADLALARRRFPGTPIVPRLEALVAAARPLVYARARGVTTVREWARRGYWVRVRERPVMLLIAALALFGPMVLTAVWSWNDPQAGAGLVPGEFAGVTDPKVEGDDLGLAADEQASFSAQIFTNNIRVTALAFGAGVLLGVGSLYFLAYNGVVIGAVIGLGIDAGNGRALFSLVLAHGVLELSCIVVGGAAGLRMGWAIVDPGRRTRLEALQAEAVAGVEMMVGTALWLVVAGLIEGFVTPSGLTVASAGTIGGIVGAVYWTLVVVLGRPETTRDRWGRRVRGAPARVTVAPGP